MQGRMADAKSSFRRAHRSCPRRCFLRNNLGLALAMEGKASEAIPVLQALLREDTGSRRVRSNLALAYAVSGDRGQAMATLSPLMDARAAATIVASYQQIGRIAPDAVGQTAMERPAVPNVAEAAPTRVVSSNAALILH